MQLYSVTIAGIYPLQCATVTDCPDRASYICEAIKDHFPHLRGNTYVECVESFFPSHMTDCDFSVSQFLLSDEVEKCSMW